MKLNSSKPQDKNPPPAPKPAPPPPPADDLKAAAQSAANIPIWKEFGHFLLHNKKWWLLPILLILLGLSALMFLSGTALAPFMYTLF